MFANTWGWELSLRMIHYTESTLQFLVYVVYGAAITVNYDVTAHLFSISLERF